MPSADIAPQASDPRVAISSAPDESASDCPSRFGLVQQAIERAGQAGYALVL
jgi:hypothetical protein